MATSVSSSGSRDEALAADPSGAGRDRPERAGAGQHDRAGQPGRRRIWFVCEVYHPETTGTGWFLTGLCEALAADFEIGVICCQPNYSARGLRAALQEVRRGVHVIRCNSPVFDTRRLGTRFGMWIWQSVIMGLKAWRHVAREDIVVVLTNPPLLPHALRLLLPDGRQRMVVYAHDLYPQALVCAGLLEQDGHAQRLLNLAAGALHRSVAAVVVDGRDGAVVVAAQGVRTDRVAVVPYWGEPGLASPRPSAEGKGLVIGCSGTLGRLHDLGTVLACAADLRDEQALRWVLRGEGTLLDRVREELTALRLRNVELQPPLPWSRLREVFVGVDVCIIAMAPHARGAGTPSRLYNALAAARPVIAVAEAETELAMLVAETGSGWVTPPADPGALGALVRTLLGDPQRVARAAERARETGLRYTRSRTAEAFSRILEPLTTRPS